MVISRQTQLATERSLLANILRQRPTHSLEDVPISSRLKNSAPIPISNTPVQPLLTNLCNNPPSELLLTTVHGVEDAPRCCSRLLATNTAVAAPIGRPQGEDVARRPGLRSIAPQPSCRICWRRRVRTERRHLPLDTGTSPSAAAGLVGDGAVDVAQKLHVGGGARRFVLHQVGQERRLQGVPRLRRA